MVEHRQSTVLQCQLLWHANGIGLLCRCRFIQRLLKEDVDREVRAGHVHQHRDLALLPQ